MDINTLKEKLSDSEFSTLQSYVTGLVEAKDKAREESISGRKTLKAELETLRGVKAKLYDKLGLEDDADLDALEVPTKEAGVEASKQFERKLKKLEQDLAAERDARTAIDTKYRSSMTEAALSKALSDHDFVDRDLVLDYVKSRTKFENDELVYVDGDKTLSLSEGVKYFATQKPHLLKSTGTGGSGFNTNVSSSKGKSFADMNLTERSELYKTNKPLYDQLKAAAA